jgi:hypothetical protein
MSKENTNDTSNPDLDFMDSLYASAEKLAGGSSGKDNRTSSGESATAIPEEDVPTTEAGMAGAVIRGAAPTAAYATAGALMGAPFGQAVAGAKFGAGVPAYGDMMVSALNSMLKTHYTTPSDAITHLLDKTGIEEPRSHAEKIAYQFARGGSEALGAATSAGIAGESAYLANSPVAKSVVNALANAPVEQAVAGSLMQGGAEAIKEGGGSLPAQIAIPAATVAGLSGLKALIPAARKTLEGIAPAVMSAMEGDKAASQALASAAAPNPRLSQAAEELGLKDLPPELLTRNPQYQGMSQAVQSVPGSMTGTRQMEALKSIGERAEKLIAELGGKTDLSQISDDVRNSMMQTKKELEERANLLYGVQEESFDKSISAPAKNVLKAIEDRLKLLGGDESELSAIERRIYKSLRPQMRGTSSKIQQPSYELLDTIRKEVGDAIGRSGPFKDSVSGEAKKYYALLSEDQNQILSDNKLGKIAEMARESVKKRKVLEDQIVELYGNEVNKSLAPSLTSSVSALPSGDASRFLKIMENVPADMREQVAVSGLTSAFGKAANNSQLNFNTYSKWYEGLQKNKAAYNALVSNLPKGATEQMENLYLISKNVNNALQKTVRTGLITEAMKAPESLMSKVKDIAKRAAIGAAVGAPVAGAGHYLGIHPIANELGFALTAATMGNLSKPKGAVLQRADEFLMSPDFQKLVAASTEDPERFKKVAQIVQNSSNFKKFADAAGLSIAQRTSFFNDILNPPQEEEQVEP